MRCFIKIALVVITCFFITGCDRATSNPQIAYGLLVKCRDFLSFCLFLANQEKPHFNFIAQRYYYAVLLLASITFQWQKKKGREFAVFNKHEDVWQIMPHSVKELYGEKLKKLRTCCDYVYDDKFDNEFFCTSMHEIVCEKSEIFTRLKEKSQCDCDKFFSKSSDCDVTKESCDSLFDEILQINNNLKDSLQKGCKSDKEGTI